MREREGEREGERERDLSRINTWLAIPNVLYLPFNTFLKKNSFLSLRTYGI